MTNHMSPKTLGRFDRLDRLDRFDRADPFAPAEGAAGARAERGSERGSGRDEIDLLALGRVLWRGKVWILAAAVFAATLGWFWATRVATPLYTAAATVVLEPSQASVVSLDSVVSGLGSDQLSINTEAEVLTSRRLMARLAARERLIADPEFNPWAGLTAGTDGTDGTAGTTGADTPPPPLAEQHEAVLRALSGALSVANVNATYVFRITAVTADPAQSAALANALAEIYVADRLQVKFDATEAATGWLGARVAELRHELEASETALQAFAAGTDLVSREALAALGRQLKDNRARRADLEAERDRAAAALAAEDPGALATAAGDEGLAALVAAGAAPERIAARAATLRARLEAERAGAAARIAALAEAAEALAAAHQSQSTDLVRLEQMQRETEASRTLYEYFLTRLKETAVQQGIQTADARVLSEAAVPRAPSAPRKTRVLAVALLIGALAGAAVLVLREMFHSGFRTAEALEAETGHAVFGQIPRIPGRARPPIARRFFPTGRPLGLPLELQLRPVRATSRAEVLDHLIDNPTSAAAEAVRNLRTSLMLAGAGRPPKVILSTSAMPGDGKTTVAIALAQNFARLGKRVLLVEGDMRHRVFGAYFDLPDHGGLRAVLAAEKSFEAAVTHVERLGADVLPGGDGPASAADLFTSERFATLVAGLRQRYDVVLIDMPPVLLVPDARIAAGQADAVLFAVKWDHTSRAQLDAAIRQFEIAGTRITGLVLTQIDPRGMRKYGYAGKYGAYGAYGGEYYGTGRAAPTA